MNETEKIPNDDSLYDKSQPHSEAKNLNDSPDEIKLQITICQATNLPKLGWLKKPDPYVTVHLISQPNNLKTTHFKSRILNPIWNEKFDLITSDMNDILLINMYHYMNDKKIIDEVQYQINSLTVDGAADKKEIEMTFNNKSAGKINFEVQAFKIPNSYVKPFCTFSAPGAKYIKQKFYRCITCGFNEKNAFGICENCVKHCHKGHNVCLVCEDDDGYTQCFCDCPKKCNCNCMPEKCDLPCTSIETNGKEINQPMYYCGDCDSSCEILICQNCAMKFHHEHHLIYLGIVESEVCQNNNFNGSE